MDAAKTGKLIRKLRKEHKMSQDALAENLHITRQAISNWEVGKAFPDSDILLSLSELFDVSIKELLLGERNIPKEVSKDDKKEENDEKYINLSKELIEEYSNELLNSKMQEKLNENKELENIALDLVDKYNNKTKVLKKASLIFIITIITLLLIFFIYYFITSYNTIKIYKISGTGDNFYTKNGVMINTKQKSYIRLGKLESFESKDINKVKLYYYNKNKKKIVLYNDNISDVLLTDYYGYNEFYKYEDLEYVKNNLYIDIEYDNKLETIKLKITKDFSNDNIFNRKVKNSIEKDKIQEIDADYSKKILTALEEKGHKEDNIIKYEVDDNNKKIVFTYFFNNLEISIIENDIEEIFNLSLNIDKIIIYRKTIDCKENNYYKLTAKEKNKLNKKEKEIYSKMISTINKYLVK